MHAKEEGEVEVEVEVEEEEERKFMTMATEAGLEKLSESLQMAESKKCNFGKSILSLLSQWKEFEGELDLARKGFCDGLRELGTKEQKLNLEMESLELSREWMEQKVREIRDKESDFSVFRDMKMKDLERREREFDRIKEAYSKSVCESLGVHEKKVEGLIETLKSEKLEMEGLKNLLEKRNKEIGLEEEAMENKREELERIEISIEKRTRELKHNEERVKKEREQQAELKEEQLNLLKERQTEIESKERQLQLAIEDIEFQEKKIAFIRNLNEKRIVELDLKEKHLREKGLKDLEARRKGFEKQIKKFEEREKEFHSNNTNLLLRKKLHEEETTKLQQEKKKFDLGVKQFELAKTELEKSLKDFDLEKKESLTRTQLLEMESKDLESKWKKFERRIEELSKREKLLEKSFEDLHLKEKLIKEDYNHLESKKKNLEDSTKKFELKEKELGLNGNKVESEKKLLEKNIKHLESRRNQLEETIKKFELKEKDLGLNEKKVEAEKKVLEKNTKHLESRRKELEESIKKFEYREKEFELIHKKIDSEKKLLEKDSKDLESGRRELEERIKNFELRLKELELREEKLESGKKLIEEDSKTLETRREKLESGKKLIEEDSKSLESRRKELEERIQKSELIEKQLDLKEKQLSGGAAHAHLETELDCSTVSKSLSSNDIDLKFVTLMMGGKDLQILLNKHEKDHHLMAGEIITALQLSKDPAKLVLDAVDGFFPPHLNNGSGEFSSYVVKKSCKLLLQQLMKISPQIERCVRDNALKVAREWKAKLTIKCSLEVSSFLYLLGTYDLVSAFDGEEIMSFLNSISRHEKKLDPELCCRLGLKEKIPSVIKNLLKSNQILEAIKFIYGFELVHCFPPVPILKNYLKDVKMYANTVFRNRGTEINAQNEFIDTRVAAVRCVINCIFDYQLQSEYSPKGLKNCIKQLLKQKRDKEMKGSSNYKDEVGQTSSTAPLSESKVQSCASSRQPKAQSSAPDLSNKTGGPPHPMAVIIANMDGEKLLAFLSSYSSEHELLRNEILSALQISYNSPKLVLHAVENLFDSHRTDEEAKSCIFLLEQLLVLSPDIMPDVKEAAQNIAFNWQVKLKAENINSLLILAYLLLISAYRLGSTFHRDELLNLYQMVAELKPSPILSQALGISKDISSAAPLQSQVETQEATSRCMLANNLMPSTSMVPELDGKQSLCTSMDTDGKECDSVHSEAPSFMNLFSDPAGLILDALKNCHQSNLSENKSLQLVAKSFYHLLEHLTALSPKIEPDVKVEAYKFFIDWTAKSIGSHMWNSLGHLQLIAAYQLSSSFSSDEIFCLLELVHPYKKVVRFIRMLGLVDKVPDFISKLIQKKKHLVSFAYVYEFGLTYTFPPVALLKQHVRYLKVVAKKIFFEGHRTIEAQERSIESEIFALENVIKLITRHKLESEYPPDELRSTINDLEIQRAELKNSRIQKQKQRQRQRVDPVVQIHHKRHRSTSDSANEATNFQPASKFRRLGSKPCSKSSRIRHNHEYQVPRWYPHPEDIVGNTDFHSQSYQRTPTGHYSLACGTPHLVYYPQDEFLPSNGNDNALPVLWMDGKDCFNRGWRNHGSDPHNYPITR